MSQADLLQYVDTLNRWKKFIVGLIVGTAILSIVISFFLPRWYAARSTLIPPQSADLTSSLSALVQGIALPGIGNVSPATGETQLFLAILDSRTLRERLVNDFDLKTVYKARTMDDALKANRALARVGLTDEGVVEVTVEDRSPQRAAEMANAWVRMLDEFNQKARMTASRRNRLFIEGRLDETKVTLRAAEDSLAFYQRENKNAPLSADLSSAVSASASILARRMALSIRLSMLDDLYQPDAPEVRQARSELAALDRQIDALPPLAMTYARLLRDMKVQEQVYMLLVAQYEEAKIRENKDTPTLEVLDTAVPPERRSRPIRWLFCFSLTMAAVVVALGTAFGADFVLRVRRDLARARPAGARSA